MILTHEDKMNPLWRKLMKHWEGKLQLLREQNDAARTDLDTALLRGRIAEIKSVLDLNKDNPVITPPH